jgi:hypothetical protein
MDSWEDADEEDVKPVTLAPVAADNWDDEEDETLLEQQAALAALALRSQPTPAQIEAQKRKEEIEEQKLQNQVKYAQQENETTEEKRLRERKQAEEADAALAEELFDAPAGPKRSSSSTSGLAALNLKTKDDHVNFGIMAAQKMSASTSFCIAAFLKEVLNRNGATLSAEGLTELSTMLQVCLSETLSASPHQLLYLSVSVCLYLCLSLSLSPSLCLSPLSPSLARNSKPQRSKLKI